MINMICKPGDDSGEKNSYIITVEDPDYYDCQLLNHAMNIIDYKKITEEKDSPEYPSFTENDIKAASPEKCIKTAEEIIRAYKINDETLKTCKNVIISKLMEGEDPLKLLAYACRALAVLNNDERFMKDFNKIIRERMKTVEKEQ